MRGPMMMLALGALLAGCNGDEPAPAPEPTPTPVATEDNDP